jgi:hypothetical protein
MKVQMGDPAVAGNVIQPIYKMGLPIRGCFVNRKEITASFKIAFQKRVPYLNKSAMVTRMSTKTPKKGIARKGVQIEQAGACAEEARAFD